MFTNNKSGLIVVAENTCLMHNIIAQHGVSFWIQYFGKNYLFDVAQIFEGLEYNFKSLQLKSETLDGIIISHDHHDHAYALPKVIEKYKIKNIFVPTDFKSFESKNIIKVDDYIEIEKGFFLTGSLDGGSIKEQSVVLNFGDKGIMIIVGCSHPGIITIIEKAIQITGNKKIMGIIGGLHLVESTHEEVENIIEYLKNIDIDFIIPGHCTGNNAVNIMKKKMPDKIQSSLMGSIGVGNSIEFMPQIRFHIDE